MLTDDRTDEAIEKSTKTAPELVLDGGSVCRIWHSPETNTFGYAIGEDHSTIVWGFASPHAAFVSVVNRFRKETTFNSLLKGGKFQVL